MRILFAAPDRDLLECYRQLLEADFGETVTAFDGTQVLSLLSAESFDMMILDRAIQRIPWGTLVKKARDKQTPVLILTEAPVSLLPLNEEPPENVYLAYPFSQDVLAGAVREVLRQVRPLSERTENDKMERGDRR